MLVLCAVFFLLPFSLRGARLAIESMKNDVADWLPSTYEETKDLAKFRSTFGGEGSFVVVSWPGCSEDDSKYTLLYSKLYAESVEGQAAKPTPVDPDELWLYEEEIRAHQKGDELGLHTTGNYHEDWGNHREKWLMGANGQWYFIKQNGQLYKWDGQNNLFDAISRSTERFFQGRNQATGTFEDQFGERPANDDEVNPFYADPSKLFARFFKRVTSGPESLELMEKVLKTGSYDEDDAATFEARIEAHRRLEGWLFGPSPPPEFDWTYVSLLDVVTEEKREQLTSENEELRRQEFNKFVKEVIDEYGVDFRTKLKENPKLRLTLWFELWDRLQVQAPARQTSIIVYLNKPVSEELSRAVGRPLLGKTRGRILELASGQCGVDPASLHIGGPPADNVAIDEEGTITLLKLVSLSAVIGLGLAYLSFRSYRITVMLFFCGGVAAISSLAFVHYANSTMDAILMSMPSLVYVLGLSGAVHIVNYYRDACHEGGEDGAAEKAIRLGWFPCTLAAFTTSLGLISLYTSYLTPIKKFGFFSAIATLATVLFLLTYLPASLHIWRPGYKKRDSKTRGTDSKLAIWVAGFWRRVGEVVIKNHAVVSVGGILLLIVFAYGVTRIETTVQLLKLFDKDAKILQDYRWMEDNIGRLVPMEIVLRVDPAVIGFHSVNSPPKTEPQDKAGDETKAGDAIAEDSKKQDQKTEEPPPLSDEEKLAADLKYNMLERTELSKRIRVNLEEAFGPRGKDVVGAGMSTDVYVPLYKHKDQLGGIKRNSTSRELEMHRQEMLTSSDTLREDVDGAELWRVSIRLAALNNVDYGEFVAELKTVVEPILKAYEGRTKLLKVVHENQGTESFSRGRILVLGTMPSPREKNDDDQPPVPVDQNNEINQGLIFANTLRDLLENQGYAEIKSKRLTKGYMWFDDARRKQSGEGFADDQKWAAWAEKNFDYVVIVDHQEALSIDVLTQKMKHVVDVSDYRFNLDPKTQQPVTGMLTASDRRKAGESLAITATYTGIVPIVYKAQRSLLHSLINSICLAFVMIAIVMMLLLSNWRRPQGINDYFNVPGGLLSMLPNIFPVVLIFGFMGLRGILVDIGSMMTASVAMGVAVDDTIHFLNWYRHGLSKGLDRKNSIRLAYDRVATAMTQTTLIGGFGLAAFALSTFTPTQRFGVLMLFLLAAALVGDLIFLPAILAGPLGRFFGKPNPNANPNQQPKALTDNDLVREPDKEIGQDPDAVGTTNGSASTDNDGILRKDSASEPARMKNLARKTGKKSSPND